MFKQNDDRIKVGDYITTAERFKAIEPALPVLPDGWRRIYNPTPPSGKPRHTVSTGASQRAGDPNDEPALDAILAKEADYPALEEAQFPTPPDPPPPTNAEILDELLAETGPTTFKVLKALALVVAEETGKTPGQMRQAILAKM